jgi:hypothetical protein
MIHREAVYEHWGSTRPRVNVAARAEEGNHRYPPETNLFGYLYNMLIYKVIKKSRRVIEIENRGVPKKFYFTLVFLKQKAVILLCLNLENPMNQVITLEQDNVTITAEYAVFDDTLCVYLPDGDIKKTELRGLKPKLAAKTQLSFYAKKIREQT